VANFACSFTVGLRKIASYMASNPSVVPYERINRSILVIRGQRVMLDADLATLFNVPTKALNQAVKRNLARFPKDFMFQLTAVEKAEVVTVCDHLQQLKFSRTRPFAFTEHGAVMLANVLNSPTAVSVSIQIVRAFIKLRQTIASHKNLARRIDELEEKYDSQYKFVFRTIRQLMTPPEPTKRKIGFLARERPARYGNRRPSTP
jgi:hypothetical protein